MFELHVDAQFIATHAILIRGEREQLHSHAWRITATISGDQLDAEGLLCDFHDIERALAAAVEPFRNQNINKQAPFRANLNPTAENIAKYLADDLSERLSHMLGARARLSAVRVVEATGCAAVYRPPLRETSSWPL